MKTWPCFEKQMCSEARWDCTWEKYTCCYFCDINLPSILYFKLLIAPPLCHLSVWTLNLRLSWKSRPRKQFKNCWASRKLSDWRRLRSKDNIKNKIEGFPRVERGNILLFSFCKHFWNIPTPLWFSRNPLRERLKSLHLNNTLPSENYSWNSSGLQLTQKKTCPRKNSLRLHHSVFWSASGQKSHWNNFTANQKTANHKYCFSTNKRKNQNSSFPAFKYRRRVWSQVTLYCTIIVA